MPYAVAGSCPDCGAPIFVYVEVALNQDDVEKLDKRYPQIHYNCDCFKEKRSKDEKKP